MNSFLNTYDPVEQIIFNEGLRIKAVHIHSDLDLMVVVLNNGKLFRYPISQSKRLKNASEAQLNDFRLIGNGVGLHWPQVDEDISLKGILQEQLVQVVVG